MDRQLNAAHDMKSGPRHLPDIQKTQDVRGIAIDQVGICDLSYPIQVMDQNGKPLPTVATISMSVHLPHHFKGTHMSRFLEILSHHEGEVTMRTLPVILHDLKNRLDAESARIEVRFPYFITKKAPVSGAPAKVGCNCTFIGESNGKKDDFALRVEVPVTTLCPCSKRISDYGAHNQRGFVTLEVCPKQKSKGGWELILIEDLIELAERSGSAPIYALLKRPDERHVTMQAFDNPVFVEDVVRNAAALLKKDKRIASFSVRAVNHESIHAHNAFAVVVSGMDRVASNPAWWTKLDLAWTKLKDGAASGWIAELHRRESQVARPIPSDSALMKVFAEAIAYSQSAPSDAVGRMLKGSAFRRACLGYSMKKLADCKPKEILDAHWKPPVTCIRFRSKFAQIVKCAHVLRRIENEHGNFDRYLQGFEIPRFLRSTEDIDAFWVGFDKLQQDLKGRDIAFFSQTTSLLQLLLDLGFDAIKPDLVIMRIARKWEIVPKETGDNNFRLAVRLLQEYAVAHGKRALAVDWVVLAKGRQKGALASWNGSL